MNKQKALHALRGLEMTFEQKQEFIEALAEGDNAGDCGDIAIDISPITVNTEDHMNLTDDEINAIKNNSFKFIDVYEGTIYNYYIWGIKVDNDIIHISTQTADAGRFQSFIVDLNNKWLSAVKMES